MTRDKITVDAVLALNPCPDYTRELMEELAGGRESMTLLDVLELEIPARDRLWLALRPTFFCDSELRFMAADFAERAVLRRWRDPWDLRPAAAVLAARLFALDEIGKAELAAARAAARTAAWEAARSSASAAAWAAGAAAWETEAAAGDAGAAARDAARAAAESATRAAGDAAGNAEREAQLAIVRRYLGVQQ